jgi:hypothetical protein
MKIVIIIALAFVLVFSSVLPVYSQSGSRDIMDEYCIENWQRDPVQCANYVPEDYDQNKAFYSTQEAERAKLEAEKINNEVRAAERVCPIGSHVTADNQGNSICIDSNGRFVGYPNTGDIEFGEDTGLIIGIIVIVIIIVAIIVKASQSKSNSYKDVERKHFTHTTKDSVKEQQKGRCAICRKIPTHWEFDHIDGRGDNSIDNCQGLCRDCHQTKTLDDNEKHREE